MANAIARKKPGRPAVAMPTVAFTAAAHEHTEPAFDFTVTPGAAATTQGPFDVPAYGFLRHIFILATATGGVIGAGVLSTDYPFITFSEVTLLDVNGGQMFGPYTGYQTFVANKWGAYAFRTDPTLAQDYVATINFTFGMRIPVEILHNNGLGALANQNAAAAYKVRLGINASTAMFTTAPTTPPNVRVRGYLEAWSQPTQADAVGRLQSTVPPAHGTTQFWTVFTKSLVTGDNVILLPRVGNLIRNIVMVIRSNAAPPVRQTVANEPDPIDVRWDARQLLNESTLYRRQRMAEQIPGGAIEDGVIAYTFTADVLGHAGDGSAELFLPTVQATRLEIHASNWQVGTVEILTNDVAPVEVRPQDRFEEQSTTGFHPAGTGAYIGGSANG